MRNKVDPAERYLAITTASFCLLFGSLLVVAFR